MEKKRFGTKAYFPLGKCIYFFPRNHECFPQAANTANTSTMKKYFHTRTSRKAGTLMTDRPLEKCSRETNHTYRLCVWHILYSNVCDLRFNIKLYLSGITCDS